MPSTTEVPLASSTASDRTPTALIVVFCVAWVATSTLHAAQSGNPVGVHYDAAYRVFTLELVALVALLATYRPRLADTAPRAATAALAGAGLALLGNVVEFWGGLLQDQPLSGTADRIGADAGPGVLVTFLALDAGAIVTAAITAVLAALWLMTLRRPAPDRSAVAV